MLDDLRNSASQSFVEEEPPVDGTAHTEAHREPFLGMTASQRFVIALMLFFMVCILGAFALMVFEKIWLPIY
jgi:hypothetical protein